LGQQLAGSRKRTCIGSPSEASLRRGRACRCRLLATLCPFRIARDRPQKGLMAESSVEVGGPTFVQSSARLWYGLFCAGITPQHGIDEPSQPISWRARDATSSPRQDWSHGFRSRSRLHGHVGHVWPGRPLAKHRNHPRGARRVQMVPRISRHVRLVPSAAICDDKTGPATVFEGQAGCGRARRGWRSLSTALRVTRSLRTAAVSASFPALPAASRFLFFVTRWSAAGATSRSR
jgi:hypothetical protein